MPANDVDAVDRLDPRDSFSISGNLVPQGAPADPLVSGLYSGSLALSGGSPSMLLDLELRVDVDGKKPLRMLSGDLFKRDGSVRAYLNSFRVEQLTVTVLESRLSLSGVPTFANDGPSPTPGIPSWDFDSAAAEIPRAPGDGPPKAMLVLSGQQQGPSLQIPCRFVSPFFRSVLYAEDRVEGLSGFSSYNMADDHPDLDQNRFRRVLTISTAFEEAGIKITDAGQGRIVPVSAHAEDPVGNPDAWDDSELFAAMTASFQARGEVPGEAWSVWLLVADRYAKQSTGLEILGIMFDHKDTASPRHGCAVFRSSIDGKANERVIRERWAMHTYMHELGHCLNLLHPFAAGNSPALSWMNYPDRFTDGQFVFLREFPGQFSGRDLAHLRHAFLRQIIPGGAQFAGDDSLQALSDFDAPHFNDSDLALELRTHRTSFVYGEPVVVELKLGRRRDDSAPKAYAQLHPRHGLAQLLIQKPSGTIVRYDPMMHYCAIPKAGWLDKDQPSLYDSAYIGFGKGGFYFDQIGFYRIRGVYLAPDGSRIPSAPIQIRVRRPMTDADEEVADCFFGEQQGALLYLLGSDADSLARGNDAFDVLLDKHGNHPLAVYARLVKGVNAGRDFKRVIAAGRLERRKAERAECVRLLSSVVDASEEGRGLDNISLNFAYRYLLAANRCLETDNTAADATRTRMINLFESKGLNSSIVQSIREQARTAYDNPHSVRF